jgi:hypothetical protein
MAQTLEMSGLQRLLREPLPVRYVSECVREVDKAEERVGEGQEDEVRSIRLSPTTVSWSAWR